jgi:SAM-dependent methyltransferase
VRAFDRRRIEPSGNGHSFDLRRGNRTVHTPNLGQASHNGNAGNALLHDLTNRSILLSFAAMLTFFRRSLLSPRSKAAFLRRLEPRPRIFDIGCGNDSPYFTKTLRPDCHYTGLDIGEYNQHKPNMADDYILTSPAGFTDEIAGRANRFDAIISSHNLEHCNDREGTLKAMLTAVKPGGQIYLAFPCEQSVSFPHRKGTLNYYDDGSHVGVPPDFEAIITTLKADGFSIIFATRRYRPPLLWLIGVLTEPWGRRTGWVKLGTWALYGFESIIWARKAEPLTV